MDGEKQRTYIILVIIMEKLFVEKYRPKSLDSYVFANTDTKELVNSFLKAGEIPNLLLSGIQGTGKTSLARILINEFELDDVDCMIINASSETGIDNVRERITNFCHTFPLGKFKVVLLEEADGLSIPAQKALRAVMENFTDTVRFILTCNYPNKIIPPIQSRCQHIHIDTLNMEEVFELILDILDKEDIEVDNQDYVVNHVEKHFPDLRKIINSIQQASSSKKLVDVMGTSSGSDVLEQWEEEWKNKPSKKSLLKLCREVDDNNIDVFYKIMYDNIENIDEELVNNAIIVIAEHLYKSSFVADQEINLSACVIRIFEDL